MLSEAGASNAASILNSLRPDGHHWWSQCTEDVEKTPSCKHSYTSPALAYFVPVSTHL